jgi:hypothetical protein
MHTFTHRRRHEPCKVTASSSGEDRMRCLAQEHLDTHLGGAGDLTSNLAVTSQPALPHEQLPPPMIPRSLPLLLASRLSLPLHSKLSLPQHNRAEVNSGPPVDTPWQSCVNVALFVVKIISKSVIEAVVNQLMVQHCLRGIICARVRLTKVHAKLAWCICVWMCTASVCACVKQKASMHPIWLTAHLKYVFPPRAFEGLLMPQVSSKRPRVSERVNDF